MICSPLMRDRKKKNCCMRGAFCYGKTKLNTEQLRCSLHERKEKEKLSHGGTRSKHELTFSYGKFHMGMGEKVGQKGIRMQSGKNRIRKSLKRTVLHGLSPDFREKRVPLRAEGGKPGAAGGPDRSGLVRIIGSGGFCSKGIGLLEGNGLISVRVCLQAAGLIDDSVVAAAQAESEGEIAHDLASASGGNFAFLTVLV